MSEGGTGYGVGKRGRLRLAELPASVVACMRDEDRRALGLPVRRPAAGPDGATVESTDRRAEGGKERGRRTCVRKAPNKTEERYRAERLRGVDARYEGVSFLLRNGHRYTPDWVAIGADGLIEFHEVKGAYRFGSHGRARLAFDQARVEYPWFRWVWATWTGGKWKVENEKHGEEVRT